MEPVETADPPRRRFRHWKRWLLAGVVTVVVLGVGGPFVYIHFIEGPAPSRFSLANTKSSPKTTTSAVPIAGTWKITSGSQAGYRIGEVLFGQANTAVGRTTAVTGQMSIGASNRVDTASVTVDLTKVSSDQSQRDDQFQGRIMNTSQFPTTTFTLTSPVVLGNLPAAGTTVTAKGTGTLNLHGTTRTVQAALSARQTGQTIQVSGSIPITFADWNISNPSGGPATTNDHGIIEFLLTFQHA
jgi:polyisoprenoid-binding protein YceI